MNIALTGSGGFLGRNILNELKRNKLITNIYKLSNDLDIKFFLDDLNLKNFDYVVNCAASLNPKSDFEKKLNVLLPKKIQETLKNNKKKTKLIQISSMNVINDNLRDNYTNSKRKAEKILTMENLIIIRPNLIISNDTETAQKNFNRYIEKRLPFYPMIYPGNIYRPVDINKISKYIVFIITNKTRIKQTYNILGKSELTTWDLFNKICQKYNKYPIKINITFLNYILPNMIKKIFYKHRFLQQFLKIERFCIDDKSNDKNIVL